MPGGVAVLLFLLSIFAAAVMVCTSMSLVYGIDNSILAFRAVP
jgi:hypothetical protein